LIWRRPRGAATTPGGRTPIVRLGWWSTPGSIRIEADPWAGAFSSVAPGVTVGQEAVVWLAAVVLGDVEPLSICGGSPVVRVGRRLIKGGE
jgi:acetyltransferase-like isoleucine patch superfamily enzyme